MWSEVCTAAVILLLWASDKHLLSKVGTLISSTGRKIAWTAVSTYASWKTNPNEMIKDGYHVDEVYLVESIETQPQQHQVREIDVLRIFRQQIVKQTITNRKTMTMQDFIVLCCDPQSNFTEYNYEAHYDLVVKYTFDHKQYMIVYDSDDKTTNSIRFPIYTEHEIRNRDIKQTGLLTAASLAGSPESDDGIDIYQQLKMLAGPTENFYADTEYQVKRHYLRYAGLRFPVDSMYIQMLDLWGSPYSIGPDKQIIKMEKA